jgi:thiamine transporter
LVQRPGQQKEEYPMTSVSRVSLTTRRLVESAILIGISLLLNEFATFKAPWAFGGSVTLGSMVPLVLISWRWGIGQGVFNALVFSLLQMFIGIKNVTYGQTVFQMVSIALLDYVVAYSVIGLGGIFRKIIRNPLLALTCGIVLVCALRFVCHFFSGWMIWDALWPNEQGLAAPLYSLIYNGGYMLPETLIALLVAALSFAPLKRFWLGEDLAR